LAALYPLTFEPIFKERVWGGRRLEDLYKKRLPSGVPIGESWEISDRPGDINVVANGHFAGKDLHWLVEHHREELLGKARLHSGRFPLLIKILDAQEKLSLQVHPPAAKAAELGGEPKTEMWYIAEAKPEAELYVGLRGGVRREEFERKMKNGTVADCFHRVRVKAGDAMFLPSGRVHAIGSGLLIFEIQENSDTTYRVFDWNRVGLDGKPRSLHQRESLASIDFQDSDPGLVQSEFVRENSSERRSLVASSLFRVEEWRLKAGGNRRLPSGRMEIIGLVKGRLQVMNETGSVGLSPGSFCVVPASSRNVVARAEEESTLLAVETGS
jgi:mannose-6-phosphate isomerase